MASKKDRSRRILASALALGVLALAAAWLVRSRRPPRLSLLLVTIDTLRADRVGVYGHATASTPVLDGLARRGARFERAQSPVPLTGPSHATIFTGVYPPIHGVRDNVTFVLAGRHPVLAEILKRQGYRAAAFVGAYPVAAELGFGRGFDHFSQSEEGQFFGQGSQRPASAVADDAIAWLRSAGPGPFFIWVHFYDPHAPYAPPEPYRSAFRERPYDGEVAFSDAQLGRILEALRASGREGDTLIVVASDHGEGLGEHDEATHAVLVYESTLRVPLVFAGPAVSAPRVVADRVGTVDILPTILALLGVPSPDGLPGRSLRPALEGGRLSPQPLYSESLFGRLNCRWASLRGWTEGDWKLIEGREPELYDLFADPGERRNRALEEGDRLRRMREALRAAVSRMAPGGDSARVQRVSPEQEERLRSLGYVGGSGGAGGLDEPGLPDPRTSVSFYDRLQLALLAQGPFMRGAREEAGAIAEADPGNPFAHYVVATLAYRLGDLAASERAFSRTIALDPDRPGVRHQYGRLLRDRGRLAESERELRIAVEQGAASDAATRISLAETLIGLGKTGEAQQTITDVLRKEPERPEAHRAMGLLLMSRGQLREAVSHLERATQGADLEPWIELADAHLGLGQAGRAREAAARVLKRNPAHPWALTLTGHALILEGQSVQGLGLLRRALALRPRRPEVWMSLARAFEAAGDRKSAALCRREAEAARRS